MRVSNTDFHENPSRRSRADTSGMTDRRAGGRTRWS